MGLGPRGWRRSLTCICPGQQEEGQQEQDWLHVLRKAVLVGAAVVSSLLSFSSWERKEVEQARDFIFPSGFVVSHHRFSVNAAHPHCFCLMTSSGCLCENHAVTTSAPTADDSE